MGDVKDRTRKSKNDSRTLVGKKNKLYEWETTCVVAEWIVRLSSVGDEANKENKKLQVRRLFR